MIDFRHYRLPIKRIESRQISAGADDVRLLQDLGREEEDGQVQQRGQARLPPRILPARADDSFRFGRDALMWR